MALAGVEADGTRGLAAAQVRAAAQGKNLSVRRARAASYQRSRRHLTELRMTVPRRLP